MLLCVYLARRWSPSHAQAAKIGQADASGGKQGERRGPSNLRKLPLSRNPLPPGYPRTPTRSQISYQSSAASGPRRGSSDGPIHGRYDRRVHHRRRADELGVDTLDVEGQGWPGAFDKDVKEAIGDIMERREQLIRDLQPA